MIVAGLNHGAHELIDHFQRESPSIKPSYFAERRLGLSAAEFRIGQGFSAASVLSGYASTGLGIGASMGLQTNFANLKSYSLYRKNGALNGNKYISGTKFIRTAKWVNRLGLIGTATSTIYESHLSFKYDDNGYLHRGMASAAAAFIPYIGWGVSYGISNIPHQYFRTTGVTKMFENWTFTCFVKGTTILMANGSTKTIENIKMGDEILSVDTKSMHVEKDVVQELPVKIKKYKKIHMKLSDNSVLEFSPAHPFWVIGKGWSVVDLKKAKKELRLEVSKMTKGDKLLKYQNGKLRPVLIVELYNTEEEVEMYNIENVKKNNTFFANGILVHNKR